MATVAQLSRPAIYISCLHEYPWPGPYYPPGHNVDDDVEGLYRIAFFPRWCQQCAGDRCRQIDFKLDHREPDNDPFPGLEEEAYTLGLRSGRRLGILLDFNMGFTNASIAVTRLDHPRDMTSVIRGILQRNGRHQKLHTWLFSLWEELEWKKNLQANHEDMSEIDRTVARFHFSRQQQTEIRGLVQQYRRGQLKGMYWLWRLESLAIHETRPHVQKRYWEQALERPILRKEISSKVEVLEIP